MTLQQIILEKLTDYAKDYGLEAGLDLLLTELEAEAWTAKLKLINNQNAPASHF